MALLRWDTSARTCFLIFLTCFFSAPALAQNNPARIIMHIPGYPEVFELNKGKMHTVLIQQAGSAVQRSIKLVSVTPYFESTLWFPAGEDSNYQKAEVVVEVSGEKMTLLHHPYQMSVVVNGLRLFVEEIKEWALDGAVAEMRDVEKDVRFSVKAAGEPWGPQTMVFPLQYYRCKAATYQNTWSSLVPYNARYYHRGEDYGAIPDSLMVVAPFRGVITATSLARDVSIANSVLIKNQDDVVAEVAHMDIENITDACTMNNQVNAGTILGKTGMKWNGKKSQVNDPDCHIELRYQQSSLASYPYLMDAFLRTYSDPVVAVAGGYQFTMAGKPNLLTVPDREPVREKPSSLIPGHSMMAAVLKHHSFSCTTTNLDCTARNWKYVLKVVQQTATLYRYGCMIQLKGKT